jgi:light-regulated signal transduction histidine kinase (bacteriophytochrome)
MSVSLVRDGRLWGLIACHHGAPRAVSYELREACKHLGQVLSQQLAAREDEAAYREARRLRASCDELLAMLAAAPLLEEALVGHLRELQAAIPSDGAAMVRGEEVTVYGNVPYPPQVRELAGWLLTRERPRVYATARLPEEYTPASTYRAVASGLLATFVSREAPPLALLWFRAEQSETIDWAGDPRKVAEPGAELGTLNPRRSFELWRETVRGRSRPWTPAEIEAAGRLGEGALDLRRRQQIRELNVQLRRSLGEQEELLVQKDLLMREMNHRVQNSLQLVGSLLRLQAGATEDDEVKAQFEEAGHRLAAVAMVHRRLWRSERIGLVNLDTYLRELRDELVRSWGSAWDEQVRVHAAPVLGRVCKG